MTAEAMIRTLTELAPLPTATHASMAAALPIMTQCAESELMQVNGSTKG